MTRGSKPAVSFTAIGASAGAAVVFRAQGQLRVAVIVKATFIITPDRPMLWIDPTPLNTETVLGTPAAADYDLAPWKPQVDVLLRGSAKALGAATSPSLPVRLMMSRGASIVLDKKVNLPNPNKAARLPLAGDFGGIAPHDPVRRTLVSFQNEAEFLSDPIVSFPPDFRWEYFNVAPINQRIAKLHGDEWVRLEGTHSQLPYVQSELPGIRALAKVFGPTDELRSGKPLPLVADTLTIDVDRTRAWLVWRASFPVERESDLTTLHIAAGAETATKPAEFPRSYEEVHRSTSAKTATLPRAGSNAPPEKDKTIAVDDIAPLTAPIPFNAPESKPLGKQLAVISPADFARLRAAGGPAQAVQPSASPKVEVRSIASHTLDPEAALPREALPFHDGAAPKPPAAKPSAPPPPAPKPSAPPPPPPRPSAPASAAAPAPIHYEKRHIHTLDPEAGAGARIPLPFQPTPAPAPKSATNNPIPVAPISRPFASAPRPAPSASAPKPTPSYAKASFNLTLAPEEGAAPVLPPFAIRPAAPSTGLQLSLGAHFLRAMERSAAKAGAPKT